MYTDKTATQSSDGFHFNVCDSRFKCKEAARWESEAQSAGLRQLSSKTNQIFFQFACLTAKMPTIG